MDIIVLVAVALLRLVGLTLDQLQEGVERLETAFVHQYAAQEAPARRFEGASVKPNQDGDVRDPNLGLKLEAARAPVEVVVIERLERPTPH